MCLWKEPPQVSERVVFAEFDWKYETFLNIKREERELKILMFNYWNDLFLGSVETNFLEHDAYVYVKRAPAGVQESPFCLIRPVISNFLNIKTEE